MTRFKFLLLFALSVSWPVFAAEAQVYRIYSVYKETALTAASEAVTVQLPISSTRDVKFVSAQVASSVAATFTLEVNGTAATATTLASVKINGKSPTAQAIAYSASNAGTGSTVNKYDLSAGLTSWAAIALNDVVFSRNNAAVQNLTLRSSSITGTVRIFIMWSEVQ